MRPAIATATLVVLAAVAAPPARADEDVAIVVNAALPVERLDAVALEAIFTSAQRGWPDGSTVVALSCPPDHPLRVLFDRVVLHMSPDESARFWVDQRVRGGPRPPRQVGDPVLAMRMVARLGGAVAYVPLALVDDTVRVVARLRGGHVEPGPAPKRGAK